MARERVRAAVRKAAAAAVADRMDMADAVAVGVRGVAKAIAPTVLEGGLWLAAPLQYVAEQAAVKIAERHEFGKDRLEALSLYLMTAMMEFVTGLVADFDVEHFASWSVAQEAAESG